MEAYSAFMKAFVAGYTEPIDCADLALLGLVRFASQEGLPLRLKYWSKSEWSFYDVSSAEFSSVDQFERAVLVNLGALNIIDNTAPLPLSQLQAGDLLMTRWSSTLGHTRIVTSSTCNKQCSDASIVWYQGNLPVAPVERKTGLFSGIPAGTLPATGVPRRWKFENWLP